MSPQSTPLRRTSIPRLSAQGRRYVNEVLDFGIHNTRSPGFTGRLEREFAARFNRRFGILHSNGTVTMQAALAAAGIGAGDEVIVPAFTVFMTAAAALFVNAAPIVADVDPQMWTIDPLDIRQKITPRTKAIIPVSICGLSPDMDPILELAGQHKLIVIEDNAQCFLGGYKGRLVGSMGEFSSFSFQGSKHMTCGEGGILLCDDEHLATEARKAATLGYATVTAQPGDNVVPKEVRCHPSFARHSQFGYNFRMPEIAAALAYGEFERLDELVAMRTAVAGLFQQVVTDFSWLVPQRTPNGYRNSFWTYACRIVKDDVKWADLRAKFVELGGDGFYGAYRPLHREPVFAWLNQQVNTQPNRHPHWAGVLPDYRETSCPVWETIQPHIVMLKTNYFDLDVASRQAEILAETLSCFD